MFLGHGEGIEHAVGLAGVVDDASVDDEFGGADGAGLGGGGTEGGFLVVPTLGRAARAHAVVDEDEGVDAGVFDVADDAVEARVVFDGELIIGLGEVGAVEARVAEAEAEVAEGEIAFGSLIVGGVVGVGVGAEFEERVLEGGAGVFVVVLHEEREAEVVVGHGALEGFAGPDFDAFPEDGGAGGAAGVVDVGGVHDFVGGVEGIFGAGQISGGDGGAAVAAVVEDVVFVFVGDLRTELGFGGDEVADLVIGDGILDFVRRLLAAGGGGESECEERGGDAAGHGGLRGLGGRLSG